MPCTRESLLQSKTVSRHTVQAVIGMVPALLGTAVVDMETGVTIQRAVVTVVTDTILGSAGHSV